MRCRGAVSLIIGISYDKYSHDCKHIFDGNGLQGVLSCGQYTCGQIRQIDAAKRPPFLLMEGETMSKRYARTHARDPKGDVRHAPTELVADITPVGTVAVGNPPRPFVLDMSEALQGLLMRGDGWVRMTATTLGETLYLKYKFTNGPHRGYYVMTVGTIDAIRELAHMLVEKVLKVDKGLLRPAKDTPYDYE
jgi:hypothetical protein